MKSGLLLIVLLFFLAVFTFGQDYAGLVNPFIGSANEGYTNPGAVFPGGLSVAPLNIYDTVKGWKKPSPYIFGNKNLSGFVHAALSGTGCPELGVFALMPTAGELYTAPGNYWSAYTEESASPGYYGVRLSRYDVHAEVSTTVRSSISRYTFPAGKSNILFNLGLSVTERKGGSLRRVSDTEIEGYKSIGGMCGSTSAQTIYFVAKVNKKPFISGVWNDTMMLDNFSREMAGNDIGAYFSFNTKEGEDIFIKVGISYVSIDNARENLAHEQPGFDFDNTKKAAADAWNALLSKIQVEGGTKDDRIIFYTALYHVLIHPNIISDVNKQFPVLQNERDSGKINFTNIQKADFNYYSTFSIWDTYRNVHPLLCLVYPDKQSDIIKTLLAMYSYTGWLPKIEYGGMDIYAMVGDPASIVIADTYMRGIKDFDINLAYEAMKKNATTKEANNPLRPGYDNLLAYGFIPQDIPNKRWVWGPVSTTLEYCLADWNIAQIAKKLGKNDDYELLTKRSMLYKNYFDSSTQFVRPRLANGSWYKPFDPSPEGGTYASQAGFVEGNSWHYTFFVPHDINGVIGLMGGSKNFTQKLQTCFDNKYFILSNEPDMAYPYLFNYVKGEEWRTQKQVRSSIYENFKNAPDGLPGNDDCGTTSAYLLFSMMGLYPDCPGNANFQLAAPVFDKVTLMLDSSFYPGKKFVIESQNAGRNNCYIKTMQLNGKPYKKFTLNQEDITSGGKLEFVLSNKAKK